MTGRRALLSGLLALLSLGPARAGGPATVQASGEPFLWPDGGRAVPYQIDPGALGPFSPEMASALVQDAFATWQDVPTSSVSFVQVGFLGTDIDSTNWTPLVLGAFPDGLSPVILDSDGSIFAALFGENSGILGLAFPDWFNLETGEITEAVALLNGTFLDIGFPAGEMKSIMVHEFGHFANLTHSWVNGQIPLFGDTNGPNPLNFFIIESLVGRIETMAPRAFVGGGQATLKPDDVAAISSLYPAPGFAQSTGRITGRIFSGDGVTPLTGVNVIARRMDAPFDGSLSSVSGVRATPAAPLDNRGRYFLDGLVPGLPYVLYVDEIQGGGFPVPALTPLPGVEEFYNGERESILPDDTPEDFTLLTVEAGQTLDDIDILINRLPPGPLQFLSNSTVQLFPPFSFDFCGFTFTSLFASSNGNISFGAPDNDRTPSRQEFLSGFPRIGALWDNLNPNLGGTVSFEQDESVFRVRWDRVAEARGAGGENSFVIELQESGRFSLQYGGITARDGLAGYSCGGTLTTGLETESDFSQPRFRRRIGAFGRAARFEHFQDSDNDLQGLSLSFSRTGRFRDLLEPNDTARTARPIRLPFRSEPFRSRIFPPGADVDRFRFFGRAGELLIADTSAANFFLDTVLGLFDAHGNLIALDDNGGGGLFARLIHLLPYSGFYTLGVSLYPDFDFSGDGFGVGRYLLDVKTTRDPVIPLPDDGSVVLPLPFPFPFQGEARHDVIINSNGSLTFEEGDPIPVGVLPALLNGPPRIAGLWADLDPSAGGLVRVQSSPGRFSVLFEDVPAFLASEGNSFRMTLFPDGGIEMSYDGVAVTSALLPLVGVTPGRIVPDPGEIDLSAAPALSAGGTTYEIFDDEEIDLDGLTLFWMPAAATGSGALQVAPSHRGRAPSARRPGGSSR